jgi:hypothetical protein|tara:strand:- start:1540 stop:3936 length:2397 start_codon:yes stop_codon:yes gene_type:complete
MSYIIKNSTQGAIVARLTDAGRKKLSEGKLNIGLFQLGDSEVCYDSYTQLPAAYADLNILQAEHNAQNLNPYPAKNKGHIKYPLNGGINTTDTFGPTIPQHNVVEVYNSATTRGFFTVPALGPYIGTAGNHNYSANTSSQYTLSSNWTVCSSGMTGTSTVVLTSASCSSQVYAPLVGDLVSIAYTFSGNGCSELVYSAAGPTLFYQVVSATYYTATTGTIVLTLDRAIPDYASAGVVSNCVSMAVYPAVSGNPMTTTGSIYNVANTTSYWCDDTLSFNDCCSISTNDAKIWNMNINWSESVAGITAGYEDVNKYGSTGYCGSKEYFGYNSNDGQSFSSQEVDAYDQTIGGTWYYDSQNKPRVVLPEQQKCIGIIHYTNNSTTDFYGEKFALEAENFAGNINNIGAAKNFKIHMPWLMWHKKDNQGSGTGTGMGDETVLGQTFYVDPPINSVFNPTPSVMLSSKNINMNDDGLRYYHLTDDNIGSGNTPNIVGKVFPDYKTVIIDDQELLAAMSYKSNRSYTLPAPGTSKVAAGTECSGSGCTAGVIQNPYEKIYITYMLADNTLGMTGMHCNYYVSETLGPNESVFDVGITFGQEFPYLKDLSAGGLGFEADRLLILFQVTNGGDPLPGAWSYIDATSDIPNHTTGTTISANNLVGTTVYLTGNNTLGNPPCSYYYAPTGYTYDNFVNVPASSTAGAAQLQFGDEYFFYGTVETDIMATIYEMRHVVSIGTGNMSFTNSVNPTYVNYNSIAGNSTKPKISEIGLYDNENGFPDLMAIAKLQSPVERDSQQQFVITIDF